MTTVWIFKVGLPFRRLTHGIARNVRRDGGCAWGDVQQVQSSWEVRYRTVTRTPLQNVEERSVTGRLCTVLVQSVYMRGPVQRMRP
eukprot:2155112-Rhodomonas_salina.1